MMTPEECEITFEKLEHAMNEAGLAWVTNQVAENVRFGKTRTRKLSVRQERADIWAAELLNEEPKRSRVTVSATEPYSPEEKLRMLIRALQQTTVAIDRMENVVRECISRIPETRNWRSVQLVRSDEPDRAAVIIDATPQTERSQRISELEQLIKTLQERI
jgi:hypothetical protein